MERELYVVNTIFVSLNNKIFSLTCCSRRFIAEIRNNVFGCFKHIEPNDRGDIIRGIRLQPEWR